MTNQTPPSGGSSDEQKITVNISGSGLDAAALAKEVGWSLRTASPGTVEGVRESLGLDKLAPRRRKERHRAVPLMPEVRHWSASGLEIRAQGDTNEIVISGTPIVYDTAYTVCDLFGEFQERMSPGVAADVLQRGADVRFLFNHDGLPLARSTAGTLRLEDSPTGLRMTATLDSRQQLANDLAIAIERGDVTQMSCGFIVADDQWNEQMDERQINRFADLLDVSAVTYPASPTTNIDVARRMVLEMPVESRARARKLYADIRAGKMLSQANQDQLVSAVKTLHTVLGAAGVDASELLDTEPNEADEVETPDEQIAEAVSDDGATGGTLNDSAAITPQDGSGLRAEDPGEKVRTTASSTLRLQIEARKRRRPGA